MAVSPVKPPRVDYLRRGSRALRTHGGTTVFTAQKTVVEMLVEAGEMDGDPKPITHPVKFYEKGDKPSKSLLPVSGTSATVAVTRHAARISSSAAVR